MRLLTPSFIIFGLFVFGGIVFKLSTPNHCDSILPDDSIFVLTGDTRRIPYALRMARKYPDADLYIIGAGNTLSENAALRRARVESLSRSTYQNALAIKDIVNRTGLDRFVVITTEDHINRAKYLTHKEMPNLHIVMCAVPLTDMTAARRLERWTIEYIKFIVTLFGIKES